MEPNALDAAPRATEYRGRVMDEETARVEFDTFWNKFVSEKRDIGLSGYSYGLEMWLESARRADRQAREECAEICDKIGSTEKSEHGRYIAAECASAIRDTIAEE